jgi:hypothetical protein
LIVGVKDLDQRVDPAVDLRAEAGQDHALALLAGEAEIVNIRGAGEEAVDCGFQADFLSLLNVAVGLDFIDLAQIAHDEGPGVGDAILADQPGIMGSDRDVGGNGDLEAGDSRFLGRHGLFRVGRGDGIENGLGLDAGVAEQQFFRLVEVGAGEGHLDAGASLGAGGKQGVQTGRWQIGRLHLLGAGRWGQNDQAEQGQQGRRASPGTLITNLRSHVPPLLTRSSAEKRRDTRPRAGSVRRKLDPLRAGYIGGEGKAAFICAW